MVRGFLVRTDLRRPVFAILMIALGLAWFRLSLKREIQHQRQQAQLQHAWASEALARAQLQQVQASVTGTTPASAAGEIERLEQRIRELEAENCDLRSGGLTSQPAPP